MLIIHPQMTQMDVRCLVVSCLNSPFPGQQLLHQAAFLSTILFGELFEDFDFFISSIK